MGLFNRILSGARSVKNSAPKRDLIWLYMCDIFSTAKGKKWFKSHLGFAFKKMSRTENAMASVGSSSSSSQSSEIDQNTRQYKVAVQIALLVGFASAFDINLNVWVTSDKCFRITPYPRKQSKFEDSPKVAYDNPISALKVAYNNPRSAPEKKQGGT